MKSKVALTKPQYLISLLLIGYVLVYLFLAEVLQYNFLRSDVLGYWQDSLAWQSPFHPFHVPAYPLMIALLRGITFGLLSPIGLMVSINLVAFLASAFFVYRIIQAGGASDELAAIGTFLFGLYPFVGLTYTVDPLADMPAMFFLLTGLYLLQRSHRIPAALLFGLALVTHKAMWIFIGLLIFSDFLHSKEYISKRNFLFIGIMLLPIGSLWILGSFYHHSITWLFSSNLEVEVASKGSTLILDGLLGTFMEGGIKGLIKGILLLSFALISALTLYMSFKFKYEYFHYGVMISLATLILFLILNQHEIWAAMRFGRLLVIPLAFIANTNVTLKKISWWRSPGTIAFLLFLFLSQFAYAWYMAHVYFK
jgi:hypothetical protein